jgi:two-component system chemotaxis sensor kinase CheA
MESEEDRAASAAGERTSLLLFKAGEGAPRAVPLALVSRLEEVDVAKVEISGEQKVVQYRGKLMPLIPCSGNMKLKGPGTSQSVLVFTDRERSMGLMVDEIVDIVEESIEVQLSASSHAGLLGSTIILGQAVDVIDVGHFLSIAYSDWFGTKSNADTKTHKKRVLLVDDSPFFRNMLVPMLVAAGYQVTAAENAQQALELCGPSNRFDIIVSDIEMPGMTGYDLAKAIRALGGNWATVPLVAMSSHATPDDLSRGHEAGFINYVAKFDREALLKSIAQLGEAA